MNSEQKRCLLRQRIANGQLIRAVGAYDAVTARIIEECGFEALWSGSLGITTALGLPDAGVVSMKELLEATRVLESVTNLPIIADCESGFGSVNNVIRLVREYERAGVAAICIEDQIAPKRNSLLPSGHELIDITSFTQQLEAAIHSRVDHNLLIIARIEALIAGKGLDEALDRAEAYSTAGADVIAIHSRSETENEIIAFLEQWCRRSPTMVIPTTYHINALDLQRHAPAIIVFANQPLRIVIEALKSALPVLERDGHDQGISSRMARLDEVFRLQRLGEWAGLEIGSINQARLGNISSDLVR